MFHRIALEAGILNDARLVKPSPKKSNQQQTDEQEGGRPAADAIPIGYTYEELSFKHEAETFLRGNKLPLLFFVLYLLVGTLFFQFDGSRNFVLGFYQAITIGYSVGLSPKDPTYIPDPWFSSAYILVGAALIALNLVKIGRIVEAKASNVVFEGLKRREDYEKDLSSENPFWKRSVAFVKYNAPYLSVILLWLMWLAFVVVWSMFATNKFDPNDPTMNWDFAYAQYFAVSLCSSAGSFSLPSNTDDWAYGLAAISMMIGVPLMALAISSIVIMLSQGHSFTKVKKAAWEPVQSKEMDAIRKLGLSEGDGDTITKGDFVLLGLLRMGQDRGIIQYLADVYDASDERGGMMMTAAIRSEDHYSRHARHYLQCAGSEEDVNSKHKSRLSQEDPGWSVSALKGQNSGRIKGVPMDTLTEWLLKEEDLESFNRLPS